MGVSNLYSISCVGKLIYVIFVWFTTVDLMNLLTIKGKLNL